MIGTFPPIQCVGCDKYPSYKHNVLIVPIKLWGQTDRQTPHIIYIYIYIYVCIGILFILITIFFIIGVLHVFRKYHILRRNQVNNLNYFNFLLIYVIRLTQNNKIKIKTSSNSFN